MLRCLALLLLAAPAAAFAHTGLGQPSGAIDGLTHPLGGIDHLLAMVAVGLWAAMAGGAARSAYPAAFLGGMLAGGALGLSGVVLPAIEPMILASVIVIGGLAAVAARAPIAVACAGLALFGAAHGGAHGLEADAGGLGYMVGVLATTAALHATGLGIGVWMQSLSGSAAVRALGALTALGGAALAFG